MVADITDGDSIDSTVKWMQQVNESCDDESGIPMVLAVNKFDLIKHKEESGTVIEEWMT